MEEFTHSNDISKEKVQEVLKHATKDNPHRINRIVRTDEDVVAIYDVQFIKSSDGKHEFIMHRRNTTVATGKV